MRCSVVKSYVGYSYNILAGSEKTESYKKKKKIHDTQCSHVGASFLIFVASTLCDIAEDIIGSNDIVISHRVERGGEGQGEGYPPRP